MRLLLLALTCLAVAGCKRSDTVAEGVIYYAEFQTPGGGKEGFTRLNNSKAVPGGNGSWNVDAYGRLTRQFLFITRPQHPELGEQAVPVWRLLDVQFGDGGIKEVKEGESNPPH
jgi:hypothetical protein